MKLKRNKIMNITIIMLMPIIMLITNACAPAKAHYKKQNFPVAVTTTETVNQYKIVDTGQEKYFDNFKSVTKPSTGQSFFGQDAYYKGNQPSYSDNKDGTITDNVTGLIWQKAYEVMSYEDSVEKVKTFNLANQTDWRIPTIKEAYSLIMFSGVDISSKEMSKVPSNAVPFINTDYFSFEYGSNGSRVIDTQILSSTIYRGTTMGGNQTVFGVNLADGRIKGYPLIDPRSRSGKKYTVRFVRGNTEYGKNNFKDNQDGTVSDLATNLIWQKSDSLKSMSWKAALAWAQQKNSENFLGYNDWRLPNAKELQSIVDYSRSLQETNSGAINPVFEISRIKDEGGKTNYPFYWSSTTHINTKGGNAAVYVCFGEALGYFKRPFSPEVPKLDDVHGAGAQRSEWKTGNPADYPYGFGPQGDVVRINHYMRLVRNR
jgi:hypothetical protein